MKDEQWAMASVIPGAAQREAVRPLARDRLQREIPCLRRSVPRRSAHGMTTGDKV